jgi:hypothetical protein
MKNILFIRLQFVFFCLTLACLGKRSHYLLIENARENARFVCVVLCIVLGVVAQVPSADVAKNCCTVTFDASYIAGRDLSVSAGAFVPFEASASMSVVGCKKNGRVFFECFPYVCPEPVLAK